MGDALAGKVAIVTGGAKGLGRASVERFLAEGAQVVIADIDEGGREIARELGSSCRFKRTDVSSLEDLEMLVQFTVQEFGGLHVMFNNAGLPTPMARLLNDPLDDFDQIMHVNALGVIRGTQIAARHMVENGGGSIINTSSIAGNLASFGLTNYRVAKAAVIHFTKCAAIELGDHNVRVNCITPALIETGMTKDMIETPEIPAEKAEALAEAMREITKSVKPLRRTGVPEDVANAAVFLASDSSAYVTGVILPVDGGSSAGFAVNQVEQFELARQRILSDG